MSVFKGIASKFFKHGCVVFVIPVMVYSLSFGSMVAESSEISDLASDLVAEPQIKWSCATIALLANIPLCLTTWITGLEIGRVIARIV